MIIQVNFTQVTAKHGEAFLLERECLKINCDKANLKQSFKPRAKVLELKLFRVDDAVVVGDVVVDDVVVGDVVVGDVVVGYDAGFSRLKLTKLAKTRLRSIRFQTLRLQNAQG